MPQRAAAKDEPTDDAIAVLGRVVIPLGTPADESLAILATGSPFEDGERTRRSVVQPAGRFRAFFAKRTTRGSLALEARYLICDELRRVRVREIDEELVLEPKLGGRIHGRVSLPPLREGELPDWQGTRIYAEAGETREDAVCDAEGGFEIGPLEPTSGAELRVVSDSWVDASLRGVVVEPGRITELELGLARGVTARGRVIGRGGDGLAGIRLDATTSMRVGGREIQLSDATYSDDEGGFVLRGLRPGRIVLSTFHPEHPSIERDLGERTDGENCDGLVLDLGAGVCIEGVVRWADGRPAAGAGVELNQAPPSRPFGFSVDRTLSTVAAPNGSFRFAGLGPELCAITASASLEGSRSTGTWHARLEDVSPGTRGIELVLDPGASLRGRVVDDRDEPIQRYRLQLVPPEGASGAWRSGSSRTIEDEDGRFELFGLERGRWGISATAFSHLKSEPRWIELPDDAEELEFVLPRTSRLAGRVVGPDGEAVAGAKIQRIEREPGDTDERAETRETTTLRDGSFLDTHALPGRFELYARADGYASSEPIAFELPPGGELADLVLALRRAARIEGVLRGVSIAHRDLVIKAANGPTTSVRTDASGGFALGGLEPGRYRVVLEFDAAEGELGKLLMDERSDFVADLELRYGETAHVALPRAPAGAIEVRGRITDAERPVATCAIGWSSRDGSYRTGAITDADGRYRVDLDRAGTWWVAIGVGHGDVLPERVEIDLAREVERDFALPAGRIAGCLRAVNGSAIGNLEVHLIPAGTETSYWSERVSKSDEFGRFAFERVSAGEMTLEAGGPNASGDSTEFGFAPKRWGLALADGEARTDLEFTLEAGAVIEGRVVDARGRPAVGAFVEVRVGQALSDAVRTGSEGRYQVTGLAAGDYLVAARTGGTLGPLRSVRAEAGRAVSVELVAGE